MRPGTSVTVLGAVALLVGCIPSRVYSPQELASMPQLVLERAIPLPSGRARALFQGGRQVASQGYYDPYCELVTASVSDGSLRVAADRFAVTDVSNRLLRDPIAEIPPFFLGGWSCQDPLYQESRWYLRSKDQPGVLYLRCLVPYFHCGLGPPADGAVVQEILGPSVRLE